MEMVDFLEKGRLMDRNVNIITDLDGKKIVLINDIRFKAKKREDWKDVEEYLKEYAHLCLEKNQNKLVLVCR